MRILHLISSLFFLNILLVFSLHYIAGDTLLFLTDFYSLSIYVTFISLLFLVIELPLFLFVFKKNDFIFKICLILITFIFLFFIFNILSSLIFDFVFYETLIEIYYFFYSVSPTFADFLKKIFGIFENFFYLFTFLFLFISIFVFFPFLKNKQKKIKIFEILNVYNFKLKSNFIERSKMVTTFFCMLSLLFFFYHLILTSFFEQNNFDTERKNIVVLQLDGYSADLLYDYNNNSLNKYSFVDELNATVYKNFRTIYPHTAHFFKFFYSGKSKVENFDQALQKNKIDFSKSFETNLINEIQKNNFNFRYITYHRSAIPEGTDFGIKNYKGLRSYYLTERTSFIPIFLNLNYHLINSTSRSITKKLKYKFSKYIQKKMINQNKINDLDNLLLPEIKKMVKQKKNFFLLYHQRWDQVKNSTDFINAYDPDETIPSNNKCHGFYEEMKKKDMTYSEDFEKNCEPYINKLKQRQSDSLIENLNDFFVKNLEFSKNNNIEFIIISDHGYMTTNKKMSYGFHFDEYAIKTPLIVLDKGNKINKDNFFTLDLTGYILKNFGINPKKLYKYSNPLKYTDNREFYTYSIVRKGQFFKRWYLSYYDEDFKYTLNLHPEGNAEFLVFKLNDFNEEKLDKKMTSKNKKIFSEIFRLLDLEKNQIHKSLKSYFDQ